MQPSGKLSKQSNSQQSSASWSSSRKRKKSRNSKWSGDWYRPCACDVYRDLLPRRMYRCSAMILDLYISPGPTKGLLHNPASQTSKQTNLGMDRIYKTLWWL